MNPKICPTHLVPDAPANKDAFGAHERIADAIAQLVETSAGGKCVGLLGTWGAGKSTVVQLLQNQLERQASHVVWIFDAWAHEGDSLRRTFLESLIERLTGRGWLKDQAWNERLEYLAGRRRVTEQASRPRLSPLAIVLAVSLLFVPIGGSLFDNRLGAGLSFSLDRAPDWSAIAGLLLAFAPLLVLAVYVGALFVMRRSTQQVRERLRDALTVFVRQTDTSQRTETLDSGEPTTLEFERAFFDVMAAALTPAAGDGTRRLVIVIDNLDRVNTEQALAVWSTLQTFIRHRDTHEPWLDRLWCVLPFDGDAVRRLWPPDGPQGVSVAESFLDKTFQVRFEVPLPLLSDWKDYMIARLKEAMPEHDDDDFFKIYRLYAVRRTQGMPAPTPRELKLFVNQVGSLHRQWQDEIPLADLAYYALLQRDKVTIASESIALFPLPGEVGLVSDAVRKHLAAMAYGVPIKSAEEVLLRGPIIHALETADSQALQKLADGNEAFALVFEQALWRGCEEWPPAEAGKLLHAVVALEGSGISGGVSPSRLKQWFDQIENAARHAGTWAPMDAFAVDGILLLVKRVPPLTSFLFDAFVAGRTTAANWPSEESAATFVDDYLRLVSGFGGKPLPVAVPGTQASFGHLSAELVRRDPEGRLWASFTPQSLRDVFLPLLEPAFAVGAKDVATIRVLCASLPGTEWSGFVENQLKRIQESEIDNRHVVTALNVLWENESAIAALQQLVTHAKVAYHWALAARSSGDLESECAWLYTVARFERLDSFAPILGDGAFKDLRADLEYGPQPLCDQLARTTLEMGRAEPIFDTAARVWEFRPTMQRTLLALAALGPPVRVLPPRLILDRWQDAFEQVDPHDVVMLLAERNPAFVDALAMEPFTSSDSTSFFTNVYTGVLDASDVAVPESLTGYCVSLIQQASASSWVASLTGDAALGRMLAALKRRGVSVVIGEPVVSAFKTLAPKIAQSGLPIHGEPWRKAALDALDSTARTDVLNAILDTMPLKSQVDLGRLLSLAEPSVLQHPWLADKPEAFAVLAIYVLEHFNEEWVTALARAVASNERLVSQLDGSARAMLAEAAVRRQTPPPTERMMGSLQDLLSRLRTLGTNDDVVPA